MFGLTSHGESLVNEFCSRVEVDTHVEGGRVMGLDAMVGDIHSLIVLCTTPPFALCTVKDVRDPKFCKFLAVRGNVPEIFLIKQVNMSNSGILYITIFSDIIHVCKYKATMSEVYIQDYYFLKFGNYSLVSDVESWPNLIGMITSCLSSVQETLELRNAQRRRPSFGIPPVRGS